MLNRLLVPSVDVYLIALPLAAYQGVDRIWAIPSGLFVTIVSAALVLNFSASEKGGKLVPLALGELNLNLTRLCSVLCPVFVVLLIVFSDGRP